MDQICECFKKLKYLECHYDLLEELQEQKECSFEKSPVYETENFKLPGVLTVDDSKSEYPDVLNSPLPQLFREMADIIKEVQDYQSNLLSFWIIDIVLEGLRTAQIAQMNHRSQKATLHWITYLYNVIQGSSMARKDIFLKVKYFLLASDTGDTSETSHAHEVLGKEHWKIPFPPAWKLKNARSEISFQNEVGHTVLEGYDSTELNRDDDSNDVDQNIRDMETILEILYRTFARLWSFVLLRTSVRSPPKVEIVDLPFNFNAPKQVLKSESLNSNKSDKSGRKSIKSSVDASPRRESKTSGLLPLQAADGMDNFLRDLFASPLSGSISSDRDKGKMEKKKK